MSMSELFRDLDPKIAGPLAKIAGALQAEIRTQIAGVRQDLQGLAPTLRSQEGAGADPAGSPDGLEELKHATTAIDASASQAGILMALLEGAGRFASRAAFVLIREDGQRCWGSLGFDDAGRSMQGEVVATNGSEAWAQVRSGEGTRGLSADECAVFCSQFQASAPDVGAVLPLSLGDRVAGYLYADRTGDGSLNITALQLLTFVAGQTLETLPVRKRSATPTLTVAGAATATVAEPEPLPEPEPEVQPEVAEVVPVAEPEPVVVPAQEPTEEPTEEAPKEMFVDAPEATADEATRVAEAEPVAAAPEHEMAPEPEPMETVAEPEPVEDEAPAPEPVAEEELPPMKIAPAEPVEETPPAAPTPEAAPAAPPPPAAGSGAPTQIAPPDDVLGPGWAFTTQEVSQDAGNEALREEARRLARLLVTEIKLYNEEQVDQGRRSGDIYRRLREDIDRSRQIFEDRIEESIHADSDYFKDALTRILAGGDESLLGM